MSNKRALFDQDITPAMLEAGASALMFYDRKTWDAKETAEYVFREMVGAASNLRGARPASVQGEQ